MKCPNEKCNQQVQPDWKVCPFCQTPIKSSSGPPSSGGIIDSVVRADRVVMGDYHEAPDPSIRQQATQTGIHCPICHQIVIGANHFACPKCKRTHIHNSHQDPVTYLCSECSAALKNVQGKIGEGDTFGSGRYVVRNLLGQGGMGQVFLVTDKEWQRDFAFKFLPSDLSSDQRAIESLRNEAGLMAQLTHERLARLYDMGSEGNRHYLKMEYIEGKTLDDILAGHPNGCLSIEEVLRYTKGIVEGLQYLHEKHVVHRDLKPGNIMIKNDGSVKILDFGIAQLIKDTMTKVTNKPSTGTLIYMSPEQLQGRPLSPKSDIYSLGIIIYELLKGEPPFHTGPIYEQHLNAEPNPIEELSYNINSCILRALAKSESERYGDCQSFEIALEEAISRDADIECLPESDNFEAAQAKKPQPLSDEEFEVYISRGDSKKDISSIKVMTDSQAERLFEYEYNRKKEHKLCTNEYCFESLGSISNIQATYLGQLPADEESGSLVFQSLRQITDEQAFRLAKFAGNQLGIGILQNFSDRQALALSQFGGKMLNLNFDESKEIGLTNRQAEYLASFKGNELNMYGLTEISNNQARILASFRGNVLGLFGLSFLRENQARALKEFKGNVRLTVFPDKESIEIAKLLGILDEESQPY